MAEHFAIGDVRVAPGEVGRGALWEVWLPDSTRVPLPLMVINGRHDGPTLWLSAAMHGPEISGVEVIRRLMREMIDPAMLRGRVVAAPILNPLAYQAHVMNTPQDGYNLNRVFPGGPMLLSQRLAQAIFERGVMHCDYVIDFHANPNPALMFSIVKQAEGRVGEESAMMAGAFGLTTIHLVLSNEPHRTGTMTDAAMRAGKPALTLELVSWRRIEEPAIQAGVRGTLNVMKRLGMLTGEPEAQPADSVRVLPGELTRTEITAEKGGMVLTLKDVGDPVVREEPVARLIDPYGDEVDVLRSPVDGWLLAYPFLNNQCAATGEIVAFLAFPLRDGVPT